MASSEPEREPLLRRLPPSIGPPPTITMAGIEKLKTPVTVSDKDTIPAPTFASAIQDDKRRQMPQCIAHRGFKAKFPENTILAFREAIKAGAHAVETDVHITKDEVVVMSHDPTLKRCFGRPDKIKDLNYDELKDVRTVAEPHEPMPRLKDVLELLAQPGLEENWLLLDIKLDNDADTVMRLIGSTLAATPLPASNGKAWKGRVVLGIWAAKYLPLAQKYLPEYPVMHIGFATSYAWHFFKVPNVGFNMLLPILIAPGGRKFLQEAREVYHRQVLAWTVNSEDRMRWCIAHKLDGVITDDPPMFLKACEEYDEEKADDNLNMKTYVEIFRVWAWVSLALLLFRRMFLPVASKELIQKKYID